jgi:hypothetical protein
MTMKKMTCNNLGGACDEVIMGETAREMGENSRQHVMKLVQSGDEGHKKAIEEMMALSQEDQQKWYKDFEDSFSSLEDA